MSEKLKKAFFNIPVLVTGHTGFKGSWLSIWLLDLGAKVIGYSLDPPTNPSNFSLCRMNNKMIDIRGDIRDAEKFEKVLQEYKPEIIFHLAAQPIVLKSYEHPHETFDINVRGTLNVLEAVRKSPSVKTLLIITTDKCYKDQEALWGYRESDHLGGDDPYSASKAMAELAIASYRKSFFQNTNSSTIAVASARAGNVVGGGDFAEFRLVPDAMKAILSKKPILIRSPQSIRPWQSVLVPLSGYLWLAAKLQEERHTHAEAWNFGPPEVSGITSKEIVEKIIELWGEGSWKHLQIETPKKETFLLRLNWEKAAHYLKWRPVYTWEDAVQETVSWFKAYAKEINNPNIDLYSICTQHIQDYTELAKQHRVAWAC